jgi:beta-glucanase (GH16 family)
VENGLLVIEARKEEYKKSSYTSARLITRGRQDWLYGRIDVRAKLPKGRGTWPAIWMLPSSRKRGWPADGEIDIMEHVGHEPNHVYASVHTKSYNHLDGTQKTAGMMEFEQLFEQTFHTYSVEWNAEYLEFFIDEIPYMKFENEHKSYKEWPFDVPFYLILNIAARGSWGGSMGIDDSIWPQRLEVDFVRVYQ